MDALLDIWQWAATHPLLSLLLVGFFWAGCPCCGECTPFFSDNFDDNTITGWTEIAETWTETGGKLTIDIDSARIQCDTAHPDGSSSMRVQVDMRVTNASTQLRLIGGSDGANYYALRVFFDGSSSQIALVRYDGADLVLASSTVTLSTDTDYTGYLCMQGGGIVGGLVGIGELSAVALVDYGDQVELATGAAFGGGTASFDNFSATRVDADCPGCTADRCDQCTDGITPFEWEIVVSGIAGSPTCTAGGTCADDNGTYIVTLASSFGICATKVITDGALKCCFEYQSPTPFCRGDWVYLFVSSVLSPNIGFKTAAVDDDFESFSDLTPIVCAEAQNVDCPNFQSGAGYWCDTSSATVTVSALV